MFGRYTITTKDSGIAEHFRAQHFTFEPPYNNAPTQQALSRVVFCL